MTKKEFSELLTDRAAYIEYRKRLYKLTNRFVDELNPTEEQAVDGIKACNYVQALIKEAYSEDDGCTETEFNMAVAAALYIGDCIVTTQHYDSRNENRPNEELIHRYGTEELLGCIIRMLEITNHYRFAYRDDITV